MLCSNRIHFIYVDFISTFSLAHVGTSHGAPVYCNTLFGNLWHMVKTKDCTVTDECTSMLTEIITFIIPVNNLPRIPFSAETAHK